MNIIQLREKVKFWLDHINSPRFSVSMYENAINSAITRIVDDRYHNIKQVKPYSFESSQRLRDELYTLVKRSSSIIASGDTIPIASFPIDYKYPLNITTTISGTSYKCEPTTYDQIDLLTKDPFKRPKLDYPERVYYLEYNTGLRIYFGGTGTLASGVIDYLKIPATVDEGVIHTVSSGNFTGVPKTVIALTTTVYAGTTYTIGQEISIPAGTSNITSGSVAENYTNTDLPATLHEEIAKVAASILEGTVDDYNKSNSLENEANKS